MMVIRRWNDDMMICDDDMVSRWGHDDKMIKDYHSHVRLSKQLPVARIWWCDDMMTSVQIQIQMNKQIQTQAHIYKHKYTYK